MSQTEKKQKKDDKLNLNTTIFNIEENQIKNTDNSKSLIGNKRERPKTEEGLEEQNKKCIYCNNINSTDIFELDEIYQSEKIVNYLNKKIKDEQFVKLFKIYIEKIYQNNETRKDNIICSECFLNNFIKGGVNQIFLEKKYDDKENNTNNKGPIDNDQMKKLKEIVDIYSINLNLAINSLKELKMKYSKIIGTTKELLENSALRIMLSRNQEFTDYKQKTDKCKQNLEEIEENFNVIINSLTKKEELKKFVIEGVFSNDNLTKNNLLKVLKEVQNEIEFSTININGGGKKGQGNEKDKNKDVIPDSLLKDNNDKNKIDLVDKNILPNNINSNNLLNLQNQKKPNMNEPFLINNFDKIDFLKNNLLMSQNNYSHDIPLIRPGLGLFPSFGPQLGPMPNNILINNLFPSPPLNPQLIEQINNNQINSIFPTNDNKNNESNNLSNNNTKNNNSINDTDKNANNLNNLSNIQFPWINGYLPRSIFPFNNPAEYKKDIDSFISMKNNMNNNQNFMNNNLYNAQNPLNLSHLPFNNFSNGPSLLSPSLGANLSSSTLYNNILNIQGSNDISSNNLDQNKMNNLNIMNRDRNIMNQNNIKGTNTNTNNIGNINIIPNIPNILNPNGMNFNLYNNFNNSNNLNNLNSTKEKRLVDLFNLVADNKKSKSSLNSDNYSNMKNTNINNNIQIDTNNNEQNNISQTNLELSDIKSPTINISENNTNNMTSEQNVNNENNNINNNKVNQKNIKEVNNEKEQIKKEN